VSDKSDRPIYGSIITSGQSGGNNSINNVFVGPPQRNIQDPAAAALRAQIEGEFSKDDEYHIVVTMGDAEAVTFANGLAAWMKEKGFKIASKGQAIFHTPIKGLKRAPRPGGGWMLEVGSQ
jgi:hypothetical protein